MLSNDREVVDGAFTRKTRVRISSHPKLTTKMMKSQNLLFCLRTIHIVEKKNQLSGVCFVNTLPNQMHGGEHVGYL